MKERRFARFGSFEPTGSPRPPRPDEAWVAVGLRRLRRTGLGTQQARPGSAIPSASQECFDFVVVPEKRDEEVCLAVLESDA
jgi:hypothetical protein